MGLRQVVGAFFVLNLFVGATIEKFTEMCEKQVRSSVFLTPQQDQWMTIQKLLAATRAQTRYVPPDNPVRCAAQHRCPGVQQAPWMHAVCCAVRRRRSSAAQLQELVKAVQCCRLLRQDPCRFVIHCSTAAHNWAQIATPVALALAGDVLGAFAMHNIAGIAESQSPPDLAAPRCATQSLRACSLG